MALIGQDIKRRVSHSKKIANDFQRQKDLMDIYYVYRHVREDKNLPFYIGIGKEKDYRRAKKAGYTARNKIWKDITNKTEWDWEILFDGLTLEDACEKEMEFILLYGKIIDGTGILANISDGGEGVNGYKHTIKAKKKISENNAKYWLGKKRPKVGTKISNKLKGKVGALCKNSKEIIGCSPTGVEMVFYSQSEAARILSEETGLKFNQASITLCCNGKSASHQGWKFKLKNDKTPWKNIIPNGGKKVLVTNLRDNSKKEFESISNACKYYSELLDIKVNTASASRVVHGKFHQHRGLKFELI